VASWAPGHLELSRLHHQAILERAREAQLLSLATQGRRSRLSRVGDFYVAHRPRRVAQAEAGSKASALLRASSL
jgi:hypothetical protein